MTDHIGAVLDGLVADGEIAGAATLVWRDDEVIQSAATGWRDREAGVPLSRDSLFRIASLTKPITSVAALMLLEEERFRLDDPITTVAPEFANQRVLRMSGGPLDDTVPADRAITFEDLLTHRSGITYGSFHPGPLAQVYSNALGGDIDSVVAPDAWIAGLASLPLVDQPGAGFHYGHSTDLLGLLIARMEGSPLGEVLERRIFRPLGMKDTGFTVPPAKRDRRAGMYGFDDEGRLLKLAVAPGGATVAERPEDMTYVSGGAGLWSTLDDYLAFARLFLGDGAIDGVRLLKPETLRLMTANRLTDEQRANATTLGMPVFAAGNGFGLGVAVVTDPETALATHCKGGVGTVGWPGAYGGWWQADPTDGSVMILLQHNMVELEGLMKGHGLAGYGAVQQFHALASAL
ncbi:serine hydrolase domain-containing protein [Caulobacter sp. NIBR2454]|uniref:serine hydrolase domain-containing protein n=1 Tax=Caulobacter sp. NIBR2454 TaxID=3015996 RepID=UPI0022B6A9D2|nr:serine hydrolase domain-containing protein [Caulobacter sp. NIBR2454]